MLFRSALLRSSRLPSSCVWCSLPTHGVSRPPRHVVALVLLVMCLRSGPSASPSRHCSCAQGFAARQVVKHLNQGSWALCSGAVLAVLIQSLAGASRRRAAPRSQSVALVCQSHRRLGSLRSRPCVQGARHFFSSGNRERGLTPRSTRGPTALARDALAAILRLAGQCRRSRVTSNVRPRNRAKGSPAAKMGKRGLNSRTP